MYVETECSHALTVPQPRRSTSSSSQPARAAEWDGRARRGWYSRLVKPRNTSTNMHQLRRTHAGGGGGNNFRPDDGDYDDDGDDDAKTPTKASCAGAAAWCNFNEESLHVCTHVRHCTLAEVNCITHTLRPRETFPMRVRARSNARTHEGV